MWLQVPSAVVDVPEGTSGQGEVQGVRGVPLRGRQDMGEQGGVAMKLPGGILLGVLLAGFLSARAEAVTVQGTLLYEKFPATPQGLDLAHPVEATVPPVSLELRTPDLKTVVAQSSTDENGNYRFDLPDQTRQATLVIWAQSRKLEVRNSEIGGLWGALYGPLDVMNWPARIMATDRYRTAGPFNIVAAIHRANRLLEQSDLALLLEELPVTVFW